jgi:hypothetical protein
LYNLDMDKSELTNLLNGKEPEAITRTLAMMAYNPSIGRVLEKGGVDRFADLMVETVPKFYGLVTHEHFESVHAGACEAILNSFKTNRGNSLSYGQAQKPLNVFLKVYVDWASQPNADLAQALRPLLHVPLDSLLMEFIANEFRDEYQSRIMPLRQRLAEWIASRMEGGTPKMVSRSWGNEFSLTGVMMKEIYLAWQEILRSLYPGKPVMLDIIWVLERARIRASGMAVPVGDDPGCAT